MMLLEFIILNTATFRPSSHVCGDGIPINNVQKEVSWVVVWLTEIALDTDQNIPYLIHIIKKTCLML